MAVAGNNKCPAGKRRYRTEMEVMWTLHRLNARGRDERDYYKCDFCGFFHLTSQHRSTIGMTWTSSSGT